jgi:hypothetical protein
MSLLTTLLLADVTKGGPGSGKEPGGPSARARAASNNAENTFESHIHASDQHHRAGIAHLLVAHKKGLHTDEGKAHLVQADKHYNLSQKHYQKAAKKRK